MTSQNIYLSCWDTLYKGWSTRNVLSSVLHDKVRLTGKTDGKHAATLLMLSLSLSKSTMDKAVFV
jgi:hypothetical protein